MNELVEFLHAMLDKDERCAKMARGYVPGPGRPADGKARPRIMAVQMRELYLHTFTPERALADVAVMRRIIEEHAPRELLDMRGDGTGYPRIYCGRCDPSNPLKRQLYPCLTLRLLALRYAGDPGYREEWRP